MGCWQMQAILFKTEREVTAKLEQFGVSVEEVLRIVRAVVTANNDAVDYDPATASGLLRYIYGTRAIRETWCSKGWEIDRSFGIESVYDPESGTKIVFQNVDFACRELEGPKAISNKGEASKKLVERSTTRYLFDNLEEEEESAFQAARKKQSATTWYFCVSIVGDAVRAELSLPYSIDDTNFSEFIERIFILSSGDWAGSGIVDVDDGDDLLDFEPIVSKK